MYAMRTVFVLAFLVLAVPVLAAPREKPPMDNVPDVYGGGLLMAYSGLDGRTSWTVPCVASAVGGKLAFQFHLPGDPILTISLPGRGLADLHWLMASGDTLVAQVPAEETSLVVAFASDNTLVGRLPPRCTITMKGGDGRSQLMRRDSKGQTFFSFAYHPDGPLPAAAAANFGLKVSIDTLVERRAAFFDKAPRPADTRNLRRARALAKAFSILKTNLCSPEGDITTPWTTPDRWPHRNMWLWDSAFHSLGLMHLDPALARNALLAVYAFQAEDGFIPHMMGPTVRSDISPPPILAWAAWRVYQQDRRHHDQQFLQTSFDVAQRHVLWFFNNRRLDGPVPPTKPVEYGTPLFRWHGADESGQDNSPRFDSGPDFAALDLSCYIANECRTLHSMAQTLGYGELAKAWDRRAEAVAAAARRCLWDPDRGFFFDRRGPDGPWIDVWSSAGFLPLWAGIATPDQAGRLLGHLRDPAKFATAFPVPSVARDDPQYQPDMWRGPTWINLNYLIIHGLQACGYASDAADLREKTLAAVSAWYDKTGCFWEFYDADGRTPPPDLDRKQRLARKTGLPVVADYNGTAALFADLLLRPE